MSKIVIVTAIVILVLGGIYLAINQNLLKNNNNNSRNNDPIMAENINAVELDCKKLGEVTGEDLLLIKGRVIEAALSAQNPKDCVEMPRCKDFVVKRHTYTKLRPIENNQYGKEILVVTKPESQKELLKKGSYWLTGQHYMFCARHIKSNNSYRIDYTETIQEIVRDK